MPFIKMKTTRKMTKEEKDSAVKAVNAITSECLGKGESWIMTEIETECGLYFRGSGDALYVEVKLFGNAGDGAYDRMTEKVCAFAESSLGIPGDRTYVSYFPTAHWGWNGSNF